MTFNNLTFIDCECKEYIIDTNVSSFFFNYCIVEFSNLSKACGAIRINSHGTIEARSSNFTNTKSLTGAIHYKPESVALSSPCLLRILLCTFNQCNGGAIYINTKEKSIDHIIILNNIFKGCVSLENNEYTCIANNNVNGHNDIYIAYCQFFDCGEQTYKKLSVILIQSPSNVDSPGEIDFIYSRIEFSTYTRNCVALRVLRKTTFRVTNDTFIRCNRKGDEKPWANTISVNLLNTLKIHECYFYECGMDNTGGTGGGGNVIGILGTTDVSIKISNCTFIDSSSAISSYCESITILGNLFKGCNRNTIRITHQSGYYRRGFELIENKFIESRFGCIIHAWYEYQSQFILYPPVIKGNLFDNVTINECRFDDESDFIFIFKLKDMNAISFVNNTFRNFHTIDGGFASKFVSESSIQLNLKDCIFDSCSRPTNGGAFCSSTSQNEGKIHLTFEGCLFISNSAEENGGALFLETALDHDVNITRCHFISNEAASNSNNGFGGAIYISEVLGKLTITGCEFEDNIAKEGQAIYGTNSLTQFILTETEFINNVKLQNSNVVEPQYMIVLNTGSIEISNVNFTCDEENNKIAYPILFKSTNEIKDIKFDQVSSPYSSILYIASDNDYDEITFINLTFDECECKEYVIDVFVSKATFSECNITFSEGSDKACGGIRINKYGDLSGEINIENSTFSNTQSETGCIYYKPKNTETTIGYEKMMFTILRSKLDHCKGGLYINPELNSDGSISIIETIFNECYSIISDNHYFSAIGCSQNNTNSRIFIQKCVFHDCSDQSNPHGSVILINSNYESSPIKQPPILRFEFNIIEFTNSETRGLIALRIYQKNGHAFISNSSFTRCFKANDEYFPWANTISAGNLESLTISECNFSRCGCRENDMNSEGGNVIGIFGLYDTLAAIRNCTFDTTSAVVSTYCENTMLFGNKIIKCSRNTFRASHQSGSQGLQLIENHFFDITNGCVINAWYYAGLRIQYPPIIVGNTFENIRTDPFGYDDGSKYTFVFDLDVVNSLLFEKNTFRNISTIFGGFAGHITSTTGPINLTFVDCYFDQNKQDIDNNNSINGGGFCSTSGLNDGNIYLSFIKCQFTENEVSKGNGGAIFIDTELSAYIFGCQFISNKALSSEENNGLGGAIYISKAQGELTITGCEFEFNSAKEGQAIYSIDSLTQFILTKTNFINNFNSKINDKEQYMIVLYTDEIDISHIRFTSLNQKSYPILFKDMPIISNIEFNDVNSTNTALIVIPSYQDTNVFENVSFINCYSCEYIIHTKGSFSYFNSKILFNQHSNVKALLLENGKNIQLSNIYVTNCCEGVLVEQNIESASIVNCTFFDCYYIYENKLQAVVIIIENNECTFTQNVIDFTSKDRSIAGIWVKNHGNIEISSNHFLRVRNTFGNNGGAININEYNLTSTENVVRFNYNIIEQTANDQFSVFSVDKDHSFDIDHNCIKNCSINGYMCNLNLQGHIQNNHEFTFTNLSLIGCGTYLLAGGGLGLWFLFDNKEGKLSFNNCRFENNFAGEYLQSGGCGGSFECGSSTLHKVELIFDNCDFISNRAVKYGGALAISSTKQAIIRNCRFLRNEAEEGGGAIYVYPKESQGLNLPKCTISNCNFSSNIDKSCLNGHAILFKEFTGADTEFIIEENCQFIDNGDLQGNNLKGYTIVSAAPTFQFKDSTIRFTNIERSTAGLKLEGSGNDGAILFQSTRDCKFINCQAENGGALYIKYEDLSLTNPVDSTDDLVIENCVFDNCVASNNGGGIYLRIKTKSLNNICVNSCIFNTCKSTNNQCFDLSVLNGIAFKNNTIKNMISTGNSYFGQIKNSSDIASYLHEIVLDEITFINNVCDSLFGGGSGLIIQSEKIVFNGCKFINNIAIQNKNLDEQRPQPDGIDAVYYNGDGGGIQIGYLNSTSNSDLEFISCNFTKNKASKHGGAIAIQTLKTVNIINCTFDSNIADNQETSLSLLSYQNHFDKKKEGRGGAIYINPTFSYRNEGEIYPPENDHMKEINIRNCTFILNKAFDGFAIYIEGDEPENDFQISIIYNEFINNNQINGDDDVNKSFRALIASEVSLPHREIGIKNTFDPPSNITLVDHYGNLIQIFSVPSTGEDIPTYNTEIVTTSSETIDTSTEIYSSTETDSISFSESTEIFESSSLTQTDEISLSIISPKISDDFISYPPTEVSAIDSEQKTTENYFESSLTNTQINSDVDFTSSKTNNGAAIGSSNKKKGLSIGAIIGIVCGIVVVVIAVVSVSVFLLVKRRKIPKNSFHDEMSNRNESKSTKSITIDRDDEDVDLNFWL